MTTAETLRAILALVEDAKAGSEELDAKILCALAAPEGATVYQSPINSAWCITTGMGRSGRPNLWEKPRGWHRHEGWPLTTSIDAALALVAKVLPGQEFTLHSKGARWAPGEPIARIRFEPLTSAEGSAPTMPLAILAAMIRALIH